jgi:hypothetical protein
MLVSSILFHLTPLSRFPQRGKALYGAPSPVGEGWEGGHNYLSNYCFIYDFRYSKIYFKRLILLIQY